MTKYRLEFFEGIETDDFLTSSCKTTLKRLQKHTVSQANFYTEVFS